MRRLLLFSLFMLVWITPISAQSDNHLAWDQRLQALQDFLAEDADNTDQ